MEVRQVTALQATVRDVEVEDSLYDYLLDIVEATRRHDEIYLGASTRGALSLYRAAQAWAVIDGRSYLVPDDIKRLAVPVLSHRILVKGHLQGGERNAVESIIQRIVEETPTPD